MSNGNNGSADFDIDEFLSDPLEEELQGFKIPNLGEKPTGYVIDRLGVIKDRLKRLKKYEKLFADNLKARLPQPDPTMDHWGARGNRFEADIGVTQSARLDTTRVKEEYPEVYTACLKTSTTTTLRIKEG